MQTLERALLKSERRWLRVAAERQRAARRKLALRTLIACLVVFGPLAAVTLAVSKVDWRLVVAIWAAVGLSIYLWVYVQERWRMSRSVQSFVSALGNDTARVTQIQSNAVVEIEEWDDEGAAYAFQLPERKIVFIDGEAFRASSRFPNSDFDVVELLGGSDGVAGIFLKARRETLSPLRKLSLIKQKDLRWPKHLQVIDGSLDELEQLLRRSSSTGV
jgi:hypothetical protein